MPLPGELLLGVKVRFEAWKGLAKVMQERYGGVAVGRGSDNGRMKARQHLFVRPIGGEISFYAMLKLPISRGSQ